MLETIFGNRTAEAVFRHLATRKTATATEVARACRVPLNMVQKQLARFEDGGILASWFEGRRKLYAWNRQCPLYPELRRLVRKGTIGLKRWLEKQPHDAGDASRLSPRERLEVAEELCRQAELANPYPPPPPFVRSFSSFREYERWRRAQTNPWFF